MFSSVVVLEIIQIKERPRLLDWLGLDRGPGRGTLWFPALLFQNTTDLLRLVYEHWHAKPRRTGHRPDLPQVFHDRQSTLVLLVLLAVLMLYVVLGSRLIIRGEPFGWFILCLSVVAAILCALVLRCESKLIVQKDSIVQCPLIGRHRRYSFGQFASISLSPRPIIVKLRDGRRLLLGPYSEGILTPYHCLTTAWQAWRDSLDSSPGVAEEAGLAGETSGP